MDLYLLKVKHIYDEEFEECGIFSSKTKMEEGKKKYLAIKKKDSFKADEFSFTYSMLKLDELYWKVFKYGMEKFKRRSKMGYRVGGKSNYEF